MIINIQKFQFIILLFMYVFYSLMYKGNILECVYDPLFEENIALAVEVPKIPEAEAFFINNGIVSEHNLPTATPAVSNTPIGETRPVRGGDFPAQWKDTTCDKIWFCLCPCAGI